LAKKWDAVSKQLDVRVLARARAVDAEDLRFRLIRPGIRPFRSAAFYASLPMVVAIEVKRFRPDVVITASPYEAFASLVAWPFLRPRPKLLVELHGDWRSASRLYGSPFRRVLAPLADRAALFALRRADHTRTIAGYLTSLAEEATGRKPTAVFPTYFDLESFTTDPPRPMPQRPRIAWVATLQRAKNPQAFAEAWRLVAPRIPEAQLIMVGRGPLQAIVDDLVREFPARVEAIPQLAPRELSRVLDESTLLVLSSVSEGLGRVIMEAFARGRPVVASAVGGIPELVQDELNGLLVTPGDPVELADALARVLSDRNLAERLGRHALQDAVQRQWTPQRYASALRELVDRVVSEPNP
jgi:glycosyltransferase involved in cell wall biosynthesis